MRQAIIISFIMVISVVTVVFFYPDKIYTSPEIEAAYQSRIKQRFDTLWVHPMACTECFDLYIDSGKMSIPDDFSLQMHGRSARDIIVCGNFPLQKIDPGNFFHDPTVRFRITGKMIGMDNRAAGKAPLFYVEQWEKY